MLHSLIRKSLVVLALLCLFFTSAQAHPGRTDANGGHRSGASYHYHHGYPAHQHPSGTCVYSFDDKTGTNSGSSKGGAGSSGEPKGPPSPTVTPTATSSPTATPAPAATKDPPRSKPKAVLFTPITTVAAIAAICFGIHTLRKSSATRKQLAKEKMCFRAEKERYQQLYAGKSAAELAGVPPDVDFGTDGLPKERGANGWGNRFTVYVSRRGTVYHTKQTCNSAPKRTYHICRASRSPCSKCCKHPQDLAWFQKYAQIKAIKRKYGIADDG